MLGLARLAQAHRNSSAKPMTDFVSKLLAYYPCQTDMQSVVGAANAFTGTVPTYTSGVVGNSAQMNSVMSAGLPSGLTSNSITLGGWFSVQSLTADLFLTRSSAGGNYESVALENYPSTAFKGQVNPGASLSQTPSVFAGFHYLAISYDGAKLTFYVDNSTPLVASIVTNPNAPTELQLGYDYGNAYGFACEQLFVLSRSITQSEYTFLYNSGTGRSWADIQAAS